MTTRVQERLRVDLTDRLDARAAPGGGTALAAFRFAGEFAGDGSGPTPVVVDVPLEPVALEGAACAYEVWSTGGDVRRFEVDGFDCAATEGFLFGSIAVDAEDVEAAARDAYARLLRIVGSQEQRHLVRAWNVVPRIHDGAPQADGGTLERYRAFSRGRAEAFEEAFGEDFERELPAASAVGSDRGPLVVAFLSARSPATHHENPRQVAAWRYPERYGPRPPSFARATTAVADASAEPQAGASLLISGTASVVGHETAHPGDVRAQIDETIANLDALCAAPGTGARASIGALRAYVRRAADAGVVLAALRTRYGAEVPVAVLRADICREDLVVEVEGVAALEPDRPHGTETSRPESARSSDRAEYDAVVIGGAFAGASTALLLRRLRPGARVLVVERQREFDRKVGEATVEVSAHFLTEVLRLGDHLVREHLPKHGLNYWFHRDGDETLGEMTEVGASPVPSLPSFLMDRSKLDEQLFDLAREEGAEVWRPARVLEAEPGRPHGRVVIEKDGVRHEVSARWIVDASGRRRWLGQKLGLHRPIDALPTNAMWGRWRGVKDMDGAEVLGQDPRNATLPHTPRRRWLCTNHFMGPGSWTWMIPLSNHEVSVGLVFDPRHFEPPRAGRAKETYMAFVRSRPGLRELLRDAELVEADFRSYKHLPYTTERYMGEGFALVGDAASFLDPYYSPGLDHVSMSVYATARLIEEDLGGQLDGPALDAAVDLHNARFRRSIDRWFDALYRDKYELFGDAELAGAAFYLDTSLYYFGVVGPILRDVDAMRLPVLGLEVPQATAAYRFLSFYRRRLTTLARKRRQRGVYGRKNRGWRSLSGSFGDPTRRGLPGPFWRGLRLWLTAELMEANPFRQRRPRDRAAEAPRVLGEQA